jgi:hypothetical protein
MKTDFDDTYKLDQKAVYHLRHSKDQQGHLSPVVKDQYGHVLSGVHRKFVDASWPERVINVTDELDREVKTIHFNVQRRPSRKETTGKLLRIAEILEARGIPKVEIVRAISELVPYSQRYVEMLLPEEYKHGEFAPKGFAPRLYNVWNFVGCDSRFGKEGFPGRIPGQIIQNLLYYYAKPEDLIVDPMAGSGTTFDVVQWWNHTQHANLKVLCYDLSPIRNDIFQNDIRKGFPSESRNCDLIFLDPPYWRLQKGRYKPESVSEESLEGWLSFMLGVVKNCSITVKRGGFTALLIEAFFDEEETGKFVDLPFRCLQMFTDCDFTEVQRVVTPVTSQVKSVQDVEYAKQHRILLDLNRDLMIFRRD